MKNTIIIDRNALQQQVDLRNHYMGEAIKRTDFNADTIQSSAEDSDLFLIFLREACNELLSTVALRFASVSYIAAGDKAGTTSPLGFPHKPLDKTNGNKLPHQSPARWPVR